MFEKTNKWWVAKKEAQVKKFEGPFSSYEAAKTFALLIGNNIKNTTFLKTSTN
ncbi:MAG: hypothetical protein ACRC5M_04675 [Anaeroplasmataceae bacterium]